MKKKVFEIPKGLTGNIVVSNYIKALGGKEKLDSVKDRTTVMTGKLRGRKVIMTVYQKAPDKMRQKVIAGPIVQNLYYNGVHGTLRVAKKTLEVKGAELEKLKYESMLGLLTHLKSIGIKLRLEGTATVAGINAYKVAMIFPSGTKWIQYYSTETWLKMKVVKEIKVARGTFKEVTYLGNYRDVDGIKYPFAMRQSIGEQQIDLTVSSIKVNTGLSDNLFNAN